MAGVAASLTTLGLDESLAKLRRLSGFDQAQLLYDAGAILESSTRRRFDTKIDPDGDPWVPWSEDYDETRDHDVDSLLITEEANLRDSIAALVEGNETYVGSGQEYAAHHQMGGEEIGSGVPARPYLGVSDEDTLDLRDLVTGTLEDLLQ